MRSYVWAQWTVARWSHKQMNPMLIYVCCIRLIILFLNTDFVGSVCIDMGLSALLWPGLYCWQDGPDRMMSFIIYTSWIYIGCTYHGIGQYCSCMLVALIDIFVIKLLSYDLKDHTFILQTPASTTPFRLYKPCLLILFCDIQLSLKYIHTGQTEMLCSHLGNAYSILCIIRSFLIMSPVWRKYIVVITKELYVL